MTRAEFVKTCVDGNYCTEEKAKHYNGMKTELDVFDLAAVYDKYEEAPKNRKAFSKVTIIRKECGGKKMGGFIY